MKLCHRLKTKFYENVLIYSSHCKGKKRDIHEIKKRTQSSDTSCEFNSKLIKKRRISSTSGIIGNSHLTANNLHQNASNIHYVTISSTSLPTSSPSSYDDLIEIDEINLNACNLKIN